MPKDATPDALKIVNYNFTNGNHEQVAKILEEQWDASSTFKELGEEYDNERGTFQKVYSEYMGVPETPFNDRIEDSRTVDQIKSDHENDGDKGAMKNYIDKRERGDLDPLEYLNVEYMDGHEPEQTNDGIPLDEHIEKVNQSYRKGYREGRQDARNPAE